LIAAAANAGVDPLAIARASGEELVLLRAVAERAIKWAGERDEALAHRIVGTLSKAIKK
jgi:hypothetical protein